MIRLDHSPVGVLPGETLFVSSSGKIIVPKVLVEGPEVGSGSV